MPSYTQEFVKNSIYCLYTNLQTLSTQGGTQNLWLDATKNLNWAWTSKTDNPATHGSVEWYIQQMQADNDGHGVLDGSWLKNLEAECSVPLSDWSTQEITDALGKLAQLTSDKDAWKGQVGQLTGVIQQAGTLITTTQGNETATGDTQGKAWAGALQSTTAATGPITDACNAILSVLGSFASLLQTIV